MRKVYTAFWWHQHQPYYKADVDGDFQMPWVRLHGVKDYIGMANLISEFPKIKANINLTPSLLLQIDDYINNRGSDKAFKISKKSFSDLENGDKKYLIDNFFNINKNLIKQFLMYEELFEKRKYFKVLNDSSNRLSHSQIIDLIVLFNLSWIHKTEIDSDSKLKEISEKGSNFTEEEKNYVLDKHIEILKKIVPKHRELADKEQIEITTTPFYHPILPLLMNMDSVKVAMPNVVLPKNKFSLIEDAQVQLKKGLKFVKSLLNIEINGIWPSEGSVSEDILPLLAENNIKWFGTDKNILKKTVEYYGLKNDFNHFRPYSISFNDKKISVIFRDTELSDLVGFIYQNWQAEKAAEDLVMKIESKASSSEVKLVSIILDGENAWEYFPDNGIKFLRKLYTLISESDIIETVRISDFLNQFPPQSEIKKIYPGSWINSNFHIWIGHSEDRKGWEYLFNVRKDLSDILKTDSSITEENKNKALEEIYIAEGSDWYWWYGDDHFSGLDEEFDRLFRTHLKNVYKYLNREYPEFLDQPILDRESQQRYTYPTSFLKVKLDGFVSNYYEWANSGEYEPSQDSGAATQASKRIIDKLYFGFDTENFYLRLNFYENIPEQEMNNPRIHLELATPETKTFEINRNKSEDSLQNFEFKWKEILEIKIPFKELNLSKNQKCDFIVKVIKDNEIYERVPAYSSISFTVPDETFEWVNWKL